MKRERQTAAFLKKHIKKHIEVAIILGSGIDLPTFKSNKVIPYSKIPNFKRSTVKGHKGKLCIGTIGKIPVIIFSGRFHFYEGHSMQEITFPIRVLDNLDINKLIITNAAGALNNKVKVGDILQITDHINMMGDNPLFGTTNFLDLHNIYYNKTIPNTKKGTYLAVRGPTYETVAEAKMFGKFADAVGMSTVPEAIVAKQYDMKIVALSCITDLAWKKTSHEQVIKAANNVQTKLNRIITQLVKKM